MTVTGSEYQLGKKILLKVAISGVSQLEQARNIRLGHSLGIKFESVVACFIIEVLGNKNHPATIGLTEPDMLHITYHRG